MDIGPIWRAMLKNKAGFVLIALQIAVTLTIMVNAFGIIQERSARMDRDSGVDEAKYLRALNCNDGSSNNRRRATCPTPEMLLRRTKNTSGSSGPPNARQLVILPRYIARSCREVMLLTGLPGWTIGTSASQATGLSVAAASCCSPSMLNRQLPPISALSLATSRIPPVASPRSMKTVTPVSTSNALASS